ncbi:MAG: patatin-like phospholipase family protein [Bacteroidales bacterium]|nr:patatin-like phospholipase family protein [Bacteroidales bacterium]
MKRLMTALLALSLMATAQAQILPSASPEADSVAFAQIRARLDSIHRQRPTVVLVLSGGGARGLAHLGVIRYMEELGIPVDAVVGTSMGGLISGLYSLGYTHAELDSIVRNVDWPMMMSDKIPNDYLSYRLRKTRDRFAVNIPFHYDNEDLRDKKIKEMSDQIDLLAEQSGTSSSDVLQVAMSRMGIGMPDGLLFGFNIRNMISSVSVGYQDSLGFADLPRPYTSVATNMYTLKPKYWTAGNISDAIRSTISIPFYFRAVRTDGAVLLDGGMRNNYPVDIAREMGADIIIGSEMHTRQGLDELNSPVDLVLQTINLLGAATLDRTLHMPDLNVHHGLSSYNMMSFDDASVDGILEEGYQDALSHKDEFEAIAARFKDAAPLSVNPRRTAVNIATTKVRVSDIRFEGVTPREQEHIIHPRMYRQDGMYGKKDIETLMNFIYGTNAFESVTYRLEGAREPYTLVFDCQKGQVNELSAGIHADTDEAVYASVRMGVGTRRLSGFRFTTDLKLGTNPTLNLDAAYRAMIGIPTIGVRFRNHMTNSSMLNSGEPMYSRFYSSGLDLYIEDSRMTYGSFRTGVSYEMMPFQQALTFESYSNFWDMKSYWASVFGNLRLDTFNDAYFPTKGMGFVLDARYVFNGYSYNLAFNHEVPSGSVTPYMSLVGSFSAAFTPFRNFTIQPTVYGGWNSVDTRYMNPRHVVALGGIMPGRYTEHQIPFFGYPTGYTVCRDLVATGQLDLRYCVASKNYITLRAGVYCDIGGLGDKLLFDPFFVYAVGTEYARQTIVGPFKIGLQWCNAKGVTLSASIGFDF